MQNQYVRKTIDKYVADHKTMPQTCEFEGLRDSLIQHHVAANDFSISGHMPFGIITFWPLRRMPSENVI